MIIVIVIIILIIMISRGLGRQPPPGASRRVAAGELRELRDTFGRLTILSSLSSLLLYY